MGLLGRVWVGGTVVLIAFIAYTSQLFLIWPLYGRVVSVDLLTLLVPFNVIVAVLWRNYYLCVKTDPGRVPKNWEPDMRGGDEPVLEVKKLTGGPRYCRSCKAYKPPRTHHCSQCKHCVLKMDHHCPWVNNCVGHKNHGHFLRFLFCVDLGCTYHIWMISSQVLLSPKRPPSGPQVAWLIFNYVACLPVLMLVGAFSLYHFWCLLTNTTTIEGWEKDRAATLKRRGKIREFKYPYDLGYKENINEVLGPSPALWCWPQEMRGSGLKFKLAKGIDDTAPPIWPPTDEFRKRPLQATVHTDDVDVGASSAVDLQQPRPKASKYSPYHPSYEEDREESDEGEYDDDEDVPLAALRAQANKGDAVRTRRGSEGLEVRPVNFRNDLSDGEDSQGDYSADEYEGELEEKFGQWDDDGDLIRRGDVNPAGGASRYRVYEPEEDPSSDSGYSD